jgi:hypothetical protein
VTWHGFRKEIEVLTRIEQAELDEAFDREYNLDFVPKLWGLTTTEFLKRVDAKLLASLADSS